ncbi:MAG: Histidinol-phosphate aminotransferase [bacterium]|nr:Histidinol-phosphate aminotransferase [bacterium]
MLNKIANAEQHLYEQVAHQIQGLIEQGTLRPGERIPSVRRFSAQNGVSISTVMQAYALLEDHGVIEARPQSGYYVRLRSRELPPEPAISHPPLAAARVNVPDLVIRIHEAIENPDIVPFGAACPSLDLLPSRKLNRALGAILRRTNYAGVTYQSALGNQPLRHQISRRALDWGHHIAENDIITTFGCTEALNLCLRAVAEPGDTIAVESPTYFGILQIIESLKMKALEIATDPKTGVSLEALETAIRKRMVKACLLMPNFQNPLGCCMPEENKKELLRILARYEIPMIEDDIYGDLYHGADRPQPVKTFDKNGLVLLCASFSKTLSAGYRIGWTAPGRFKTQVERLKVTNTMSTAPLLELAIAEMLRNGGYDHYLRRIRKAYALQVQLTTRAICKYFPEGTKVTRPLGGFLLWVELPKSVNALALYRKALAEKISIAPGPLFSAKQRYPNFIRLSCGHPWSAELEQALATLGRLAGTM